MTEIKLIGGTGYATIGILTEGRRFEKRPNGKVLQQMWEVRNFENFICTGITYVWEDVPTVEEGKK